MECRALGKTSRDGKVHAFVDEIQDLGRNEIFNNNAAIIPLPNCELKYKLVT